MMLPLQSVFVSGIARRDAVCSEEQHRQEAAKLAKEAADHSKQGHMRPFLTSAEAALQHAFKAGKDEHGSARHVDLATTHAEQAVTHLSQK